MNRWIKKIHIYIGLLNFSILLVFGIVGLTVTFQATPQKRPRPEPAVRFEPYTAPGGLTDKQVADGVHRFLRLPLTSPVPNWAIRRDRDHNLAFDFYTPNGPHRVTVLEKQNRLRIETMRNSLGNFFNDIHATTMSPENQDARIRLWGYYTEAAIWSLIGMPLSGVYLWLSSRPGYRPALYLFAGGSGIFLLLYLLTR